MTQENSVQFRFPVSPVLSLAMTKFFARETLEPIESNYIVAWSGANMAVL